MNWDSSADVGILWLSPAVAFVAILAIGYLARAIVDRLLNRWPDRASLMLLRAVLRGIRGFILLWATLIGLGTASHLINLSPDVSANVDKTVVVLLILSATFPAVSIISTLLHTVGGRMEGLSTVSGALTRVIQVLVWAIVVMMVVSYLGVDIAPVLTTMGLAGLATALALQDTLANFFAGIYILADRPIRVGDYVRIDSGDEGYVEEIGWRSSRLRTLANNVVVIPNQKLAQTIITNYHLPETRMTLLVKVSVSYDEDPRCVEKVLLEVAAEAAREVDGLLSDPAPLVRLIPGFEEYSLGFTLVCQVRQFTDQYYVQHELRKRILERFRAEGIRIPFPTTTVDLAKGSATRAIHSIAGEADLDEL
ncbi:MAG: mechanosensitive ion channel family protein [Chloroflexota bacterium]